MNQYPLWKYILISTLIFVCALYALPNLFGEDPAVQISPAYARDIQVDETVKATADAKLKEVNLNYTTAELDPTRLLLRFSDTNTQLKAYSILKDALPGYVVAQNLAPATPGWLTAIGSKPMYLGLDLRGGVHFLMQVDMDTALQQEEEQMVEELRTMFREKTVRYKSVSRVIRSGNGAKIIFNDATLRSQARQLIVNKYQGIDFKEQDGTADYSLYLTFGNATSDSKTEGGAEQLNTIRELLQSQQITYEKFEPVAKNAGGVRATFSDNATRVQAQQLIAGQYEDLLVTEQQTVDEYSLQLAFTEISLKTRRDKAVEQNVITLQNRVNELGVAEPVIQRQGNDRIVVQLPGVQDTALAKEILGATATLEFRLLAEDNDKLNARLYKRKDGSPVMLKRRVIATGEQIDDASSSIDQSSGSPATVVRLDSAGAKRMLETTRENVGKPMAVVFIEYKSETKTVNGKEVKTREKVEEVINVATIREEFGRNFQITGLTSKEARNLALLLRAGALRAPVEIIEERTIGPSLGQESINKGMLSFILSFVAVLLFMWVRYSTFGLVANFALLMNVVVLIALLSLLQATLTLPGIAGIVLTLGMAVDANVLIYERIREEVGNGNTPQASIHAGFEKAFGTIADSNITTLIAGVVLFNFGTGPIKGFAVVLSLGIITSMFTAIMVSRAVINYFYGGRKLEKLPV
ncbi:MAG: protein-export membrane protein SecD [Beggiatoa sp. IS2]|nr:MAG: protein-export membrane protein SecD [Beggiatoa sp. IS2]